MTWLRRFVNSLRRARVDRDLRRELDFHLAERIDHLRADGMSPDDARLAARKQFGNALRIRETTHEMNNIGWLERLTHAPTSLSESSALTSVDHDRRAADPAGAR